ncbi:MAG: DNA polymerase III subunit gamma/tau, partial [Chloroflexota bacterium]
QRLRTNWQQFIKDIPSAVNKTPAAALLRSGARPKEIQGDTIILSFKYTIHKEKMEMLENQRIVDKIFSDFLGRACRVACVCEPDKNHLVNAALKAGAQIIDTEEQ